jgi:hypothetical protein
VLSSFLASCVLFRELPTDLGIIDGAQCKYGVVTNSFSHFATH